MLGQRVDVVGKFGQLGLIFRLFARLFVAPLHGRLASRQKTVPGLSLADQLLAQHVVGEIGMRQVFAGAGGFQIGEKTVFEAFGRHQLFVLVEARRSVLGNLLHRWPHAGALDEFLDLVR